MTKNTGLATQVAMNAISLELEFNSILEIYHKNCGIPKDILFERVLSIETGKLKSARKIYDSFAEKNLGMTMTTIGIVYDSQFFIKKKNELTNFAIISVKDLFNGKKKIATRAQILRAAIGFKARRDGVNYFVTFCDPQDATDVREQYLGQKEAEIIHVAMDPVYDYAGNQRIFSLGNFAKELVLYSTDGRHNKVFIDTDLFMFKLKKEENCF